DLGEGDITSEATVPEDARGRARIVQKQPGVVCGLAVVAEAMRQCGAEDVDNLVVEGQWREDVPAEVLIAGGSARALLAAARTAQPEKAIEVEVTNLDEAAYALGMGVDRLLLDNMSADLLREAVSLRDQNAGGADGVSLEASGGVTLENVREIAETGVEFISIGALTHSAPTLDFSMLLELS